MKNKTNNELPEYLKELVKPTANGIEKLLAAWDGLTSETQVRLLDEIVHRNLNNAEPNKDSHLNKVFLKALDNKNAYVRFLAARNLYCHENCSDEQNKINERIDNDPVNLVKYSKFDGGSSSFGNEVNDPESNLFELPFEARLATVGNVAINGKAFAEAIIMATTEDLFNNNNAELELNQVLWEYIENPFFIKRYNKKRREKEFRDPHYWYDNDRDEYSRFTDELEYLWSVIPKLPESSGLILINNLPSRTPTSVASEPYKEIVSELTNRQLSSLLWRKDIWLNDFRKEIFWREEIKSKEEHNQGFSPRLWTEAVSSHFRLTDEEFSEIFEKPIKEQIERLSILAYHATHLEIHQLVIVYDILRKEKKGDFLIETLETIKLIENVVRPYYRLNIKRRELGLEETNIAENPEIGKFRLSIIAVNAISWSSHKDARPEELEFLFDKRVKQDVWKTYLAFVIALEESDIGFKDLRASGMFGDWEGEYTQELKKEPTLDELEKMNLKLEYRFEVLDRKLSAVENLIIWIFWVTVIVLVLYSVYIGFFK